MITLPLVLYLNLRSNDGLITNLRERVTSSPLPCTVQKPYTVRVDSLVSFITTAEDHPLSSITCAVFAENAELMPVLAQGDWWHIIPSAILTCLLPDVDRPKSFLGRRLKWISKPIARAFGHRGSTHSLLAVFALLAIFYLKVPGGWFVPADALQGTVLGYLSHILADMLTPVDVPLL